MNILFLSQVLPYPLDAGPKMRIYYVLRYLAERHHVTLVSFVRGEQDLANAEHLRTFCHAVHTVPIRRSRVRDALFLAKSRMSSEPFLITRDHVPQMYAELRTLFEKNEFDAVHADQLWMAQYALALPAKKRVLDQHNAVWTIVHRMWQNAAPGPRKWLMDGEWKKLQRFEAEVCPKFDHVLTVTDEDKRALEGLDPRLAGKLTVMPICIDPDTLPTIARALDAENLICIGGMFYPPNVDGVVWFSRQVLPLVHNTIPDAQFFVVGARPAPQLIQLGREDPRVRVTGYVEDTTKYLRNSAVFVVPLRAGGGMRVKILDAWARGIPIVSTTIGCEGIEVRHGENILIADTPIEFAQAVCDVVCNPALGKTLAANARHWVEEHYAWRTVYRQLDAIYPG